MLDFGLGLLIYIGCLVSNLLGIGMVVVRRCTLTIIMGLTSEGHESYIG